MTTTAPDVPTLTEAQDGLARAFRALVPAQLDLLAAAVDVYLHAVDRHVHYGFTYTAVDVCDDLQQFVADAREARA